MIHKALALIFLFSASAYAGGQFKGQNLAVLASTRTAPPVPVGSSNPTVLTIIQSTGHFTGASATCVVTTTNTATAGNLMICAAGNDSGSATEPALTDNRGNTYQLQKSGLTSPQYVGVYVSTLTTGGTPTITYTPGGTPFNFLTCVEVAAPITPDGFNGYSTQAANDLGPTSGNVNTSAKSIIIGIALMNSGTRTITPAGGWTEIFEQENGAYGVFSFIYQIGASGTYNPTWSLNSSAPWVALGMGFKGN